MKISHSYTSFILVVSIVLVFQVGCCLTGKPKSTQSPFVGTQTPTQVERPVTQPDNTVTVISSGNSIPPGGLQAAKPVPQTNVPVQQPAPQLTLPPSRTAPFGSTLPPMTQGTNKPVAGPGQVPPVNNTNIQPGPIAEPPAVIVNPTPNTTSTPILNTTTTSVPVNSGPTTISNPNMPSKSQLTVAPGQLPVETTMPQPVSEPAKNIPQVTQEPKKENPPADDHGQTTLNKPVEKPAQPESAPSSEKSNSAPANGTPAEPTIPAESRPQSLDDISSYANDQQEQKSTNDNASFLNTSQSKKKDDGNSPSMPAVEVSLPKDVDTAKSNDNKKEVHKKDNTADKNPANNADPKDEKSKDNLVTLNNGYQKIQAPQGENPKYSGDFSPQTTETSPVNFGKPNHANSAQPVEPVEIPVAPRTNSSSSDNVVRLRTIVIP